MEQPIVELRDVRLGYGAKVVLDEVNLAVNGGDFLGLVGPNGSGKTTLLNAMLGHLRCQAGEVRYGPLPQTNGVAGRVRFGYVPQQQQVDVLFPLSALEVTLMGVFPRLGLFRRPAPRDRDWASDCLSQVGAADLAKRPFNELSGGQRQRVLVARALATGAHILLLDEPTNDMDLRSEHDLMELFFRLHAAGEMTMVFVSHLLNLVLSYAPRVGILHEGRLRVFATQELVGGQQLAEIYRMPLRVVDNEGYRTIVPGDNHHAS